MDDIGFAKDLVKEIKGVACIDPKRVYAAGFSMGGGMTNYVACHTADIFAAFGPAAFDILQEIVAGSTKPPTQTWSGPSSSGIRDLSWPVESLG